MERLRDSLAEVEKSLLDQLQRRERLIKESRDVISSSSRAIIRVHEGRLGDAADELRRARSLLSELKKAGEGPVGKYLVSPETEYVEANVVYSLVRGRGFPSREELDSSPEAYVLGLLDSVGELKRLVLDSIMKGDMKKATRFFGLMEETYSLCSPLAVYDHVLNGARRKIDVARMLVEDTRGLLTEETRRERLSLSMERLSRKLDRRRGR
jgi:translin